MRSLLTELKQRSVFKVGAAYAFVAWLVAQIVDVVNEPLGLPDRFDTIVLVLLIVGFPIAVVLAWAYDLTPQGIKAASSPPGPNLPPARGSEVAAVAVLPFRELGGAAGEFPLAAAIPSELHNTLARVQRIRVVSGLSAEAHSRAGKDLKTIARELDVKYVISGTVTRAGEAARVIAELYDAARDTQLWSSSFDVHAGQAFETQRQIAEAVTEAFGGERLRLELEDAQVDQPTDPAVWELVYQARSYLLSYSAEAVAAAIPLLERAIEADADYAAAHAQLGLIRAEATLNGISAEPAADRAAALAAVNRAVALEPNDAAVLRSAGAVHAYCGSNEESIALLRRAVVVAPYDLGAWGYLGWPLVSTGQPAHLRELHEILDRLLEPESKHPGYPYWLYHRSVAFTCEERYEQAIEPARRTTAVQPKFGLAWMNYANALGALGREQPAAAAAAKCADINPHMTPAFYVELMATMAQDAGVVERRTTGLERAGLLS